MSFDAYRVAVHLSVVDKVSPFLRMLSSNLQVTGRHVADLEKKLQNLQRLAIVGGVAAGAGVAIISSFRAPVNAAIEYERAFNRFKQLNLGDAVNADAQKFAMGANVYGVSGREMINTLRDMHTALGNYPEAKELAPRIAALSAANANLFEGKGSIDSAQTYALMKASELRGGKNSAADFNRTLELSQRFISGTGGNVMPTDLYNFLRRGGTAARQLTDDALLKFEPLIQELGGSSAGTAYMSMYQNLAGGRTTKRAAAELMRFGLLDPRMVSTLESGAMDIRPGALKNSDAFRSDPLQWIKDTMLPALAAKGITDPAQVSATINTLLTNRTGSNLASITATQWEAIMRNFGVNKNSLGADATIENSKNSAAGKLAEFDKRWEDLKVVIGQGVLPVVTKLALGFAHLYEWMKDHPRLTRSLTNAFFALGAAMAFGGTVLLLRTAFSGLGLVLTAAGGMPGLIRATASGIGALSGGLVGLLPMLAKFGLISAAGAAGYYGAKAIGADALGSWIGTHLYGLFHPHEGEDLTKPSYVKPGHRQPITVQSNLHLDGKLISRVITKHQVEDIQRAQRGASSRPDLSMTLPPVSMGAVLP